MNDIDLNIDTKQVLNLFASLDRKKQVKVYRQALTKSAYMLVREARKLLKQRLKPGATTTKNRWNGKTMASGIRARVFRNGQEARVSIMGDFRLRFMEMGTKERYLRKGSKARRGKIRRMNFFADAKRNAERPIFDNMNNMILQSILRIAKQSNG